jgi:hypothetical protein
MCIIVLNTKEHLTKELMKQCWHANGDGAGVMYAINGKVIMFSYIRENRYQQHTPIQSQ